MERQPITGEADTLSRRQLEVSGMSCAACAARVERKLNKLGGVRATVNYATATATVDASSGITTDELCETVSSAGYTATPQSDRSNRFVDRDRDAANSMFLRLIVAIVLFIVVADLSILFSVLPDTRVPGWRWILLAVAVPVVVWCAWPLHRNSVRGLMHGATSMDTLVSTGIIAATGWSVYSMFTVDEGRVPTGVWDAVAHSDSLYFEVAAGVTVFILAGRYVEAKAKSTAGQALRALAGMVPDDVEVLSPDGGTMTVPTRTLTVSDRFLTRPGQRIAADGVVVDGHADVDVSAMTGESRPVTVGTGDSVTGGTIALSGAVTVEARRVGDDTRLAEMLRLVSDAQTEKAGTQRLADRISAVFVPTVLVLAVATAVAWGVGTGDLSTAVRNGIAVLIIACPCALGLATPMALMVASGRGAELGVFIKGNDALDASGTVDTVVFDKTGTLTTGIPVVTGLHDTRHLIPLVAAVEYTSQHPVARAVLAHHNETSGGTTPPPVEDVDTVHGQGVSATVSGQRISVGRPEWIGHRRHVPAPLASAVEQARHKGETAVLFAAGDDVVGFISVADDLRLSTCEAIRQLKAAGLRCVMLTGDDPTTARALGRRAGIAPDSVIAGVLPSEKVDHLRTLRADGATVAMVGDGVNDAPALAAADLGIAVGSGTDVALDTADIIIVRDDLTTVATALRLAERTRRTIRGNLAWAFSYNTAAIPLAAVGVLNPLIASLAMALSSLFVVANSLRLRRAEVKQ
ncbi:copper-translocating P-type ATPase [Corynebacterium sp. CNJ-954]|nr:copper-translocating P-type ATPase [Corynebacterium sp. CNJ-954]